MKTKFPNYIILILLAIGRVVLGIGCIYTAPKKKHSDEQQNDSKKSGEEHKDEKHSEQHK